jgi:hypothetical protein
MSRVFDFSQEKGENICGREHLDRTLFWQVVPVQQPVQCGRDAAHISWAAWVQISLEDCMEERQHHLNESSSARLRRSQKLEILPSPNSKSLGAYFWWAHIFVIGAEISTAALLLSYLMRRIYFRWGADILDLCKYFRCKRIFQICADISRYAHIFWAWADILDMRRYFEMCAYILIVSIYFVCKLIF